MANYFSSSSTEQKGRERERESVCIKKSELKAFPSLSKSLSLSLSQLDENDFRGFLMELNGPLFDKQYCLMSITF